MALNLFLVCGLGSLGQHCVVALREFKVKVIAIEKQPPVDDDWEIATIPTLLERLVRGDCRHKTVLKQAQIHQCRAALIVTSSEKVNAEAALAIRQLNPQTRLVVRSGKENLNQLLSQQLGNFIGYEATHLPAYSFAISALGTETLGFFTINGKRLSFIQKTLTAQDSWCYTHTLQELNTRTRRIIAHARPDNQLPCSFYQWQPETRVLPQDAIAYIETSEHLPLDSYWSVSHRQPKRTKLFSSISELKEITWHNLAKFWQLSFQQQVRKVAFVCSVVVIILLILGTILFKYHYQGTTLITAFYITAILLLGGYGDLFASFEPLPDLPAWLQLFSLGLTITGTAFVAVLYALLTEALLTSKFQFTQKRPPIPLENHVVVIGLGRVGQKVVHLLQEFKQSVVGVTFNHNFNLNLFPSMPLIVDKVQEAISQANLVTAKSVVVVTDDEILNLELALMAQNLNPDCHLVIRTTGQSLSETLTQLLPQAQIISAYEVAAKAFAGAAFGENIRHLFRFRYQTMLVTEYQVEADDTLNGLLLAEVAYGYEVIPIYYASSMTNSTLMPSDDLRLAVGDHLIVLADIEGLHRIEKGDLKPKNWQLRVEKVISENSAFEGGNAISRISGCSLATARKLMSNLPNILPVKMYRNQGFQLVRALTKIQITSYLVFVEE